MSSATLLKPSPSVTRSETLQIAQLYSTLRWTPQGKHRHHGPDPDGIQINTPDSTLTQHLPDSRPGFWQPGQTETGMAYKWGGFDTPQSFRSALRRGKFAGDVSSPKKRELLHDGVSRHTTGIDCSGFISRCWRLPHHHSTRELPGISQPLASYSDLRPGDILNKHNAHAVLFSHWVVPGEVLAAYEASPLPRWSVSFNHLDAIDLKKNGYLPFRYRHIRD